MRDVCLSSNGDYKLISASDIREGNEVFIFIWSEPVDRSPEKICTFNVHITLPTGDELLTRLCGVRASFPFLHAFYVIFFMLIRSAYACLFSCSACFMSRGGSWFNIRCHRCIFLRRPCMVIRLAGSGWSPCLDAACSLSCFPLRFDDDGFAVGVLLLSISPCLWVLIFLLLLLSACADLEAIFRQTFDFCVMLLLVGGAHTCYWSFVFSEILKSNFNRHSSVWGRM